MDDRGMRRFVEDFHEYDREAHEREMDARHEYPQARRRAGRSFEATMMRMGAFRTWRIEDGKGAA